jgi:hypothetical protein
MSNRIYRVWSWVNIAGLTACRSGWKILPMFIPESVWVALLVSLVSNLVCSVVFRHVYDKRLEKFKSEMTERSIKFSTVFERQAEVIAETYSKIVAGVMAVESYTQSHLSEETEAFQEDIRATVTKKFQEFSEYYRPRKLYFPIETQKMIDSFIKRIGDVTTEYMTDVEFGEDSIFEKDCKVEFNEEGGIKKDSLKLRIPTKIKTTEFMERECVQLLTNLDKDFKNLLGMSAEPK